MKKICVFFLLITILLGQSFTRDIERLVLIHLPNHDEVYKLRHYTIIDAGKDYAKALLSDKEIADLRNAGYELDILIEDYKKYKDEIFARGFYHTYNQVYLVLDSFATLYPNICRLDTIGFSVQGRAIWAMRVTDNPLLEENEPEIRLAGNMHGDEHIGTEITLYFLRYLLTNYATNPQVQNLVNNREFWILPTLNPDGKVANSRYNANGVDLNRDYGYFWAGDGGSPGPSSQIENQHMMNHLLQNDICLEYNYHSAAYYVNYPWDYHPADPSDSMHIINLSEIYADSANLTAINGYDWYQVCGSLQDYTIGTSGALAWTIETDEPAGSSAIDQICYDNRDALMDICNRAGWGIEGVVKDSITNSPLYARIEVLTPERICVYTDPNLGDFHKMIQSGTYSLRISANGYNPKTINNIVVPATGSINLGEIKLSPNPNWLYALRVVIVRYSQHAEQSNKTQPRFALGTNDNVFFSLGQSGYIVLDMGPNTPIVNIPGNDFTVYEGNDGTAEGYTVYASNNWNGPWYSCGTGTGTQDFDLATAGLSEARYVRIVDDGSTTSGQYAGFDLDAIKFYASTTGLPAIPTIVKPLDFARLSDLQPTLSFYSTDPTGDDIQYRVLWDTDPNFGSPESTTTGLYPSGTVVNFVFPSALQDGMTYWWKVKCTDPGGSGYWTQYTQSRSFTIGTSLPQNTCSWYQTTGAQFGFDLFFNTIVQGDSVLISPTGQNIVDTFLFANFESGLPSGWTVVNSNGDQYQWTTGTTSDLGSYTPPDYGSAYAYYSDDDAGGSAPVSTEEGLLTPRVYVGGITSGLELVYGYGYNDYSSYDYYRVRMRRFVGGSWQSWVQLREYNADGSGNEVIGLDSYLPCDSMQFEWYYTETSATWGWACAVDNVLLRHTYQLSNDYGTLTGTPVVYHDLSTTYPRSLWGDVVWRKASAGDSIGIQVEYYNGSSWQLIPNSVLPGNSGGFFTNLAVDTVKLTNVDTVVYNTLRLKALFYRVTKSPNNPALLDWEVGNLSSYIGVADVSSATPYALCFTVFPNPFRDRLDIRYRVPDTGDVGQGFSLAIYDVSGRVVRSFNLESSIQNQVSSVVWDGTDDSGRRLPAGVYFVRLEAGDFKKVEKAILLR
ncbi:MAG: M14 family zinc carboxypeptidase [candidate division WOR-3 bacterium]